MSVEYAPDGLLGVLTPQANTTVEPEFAILLPPRVTMLAARLTSPKPTIAARLVDYVEGLDAAVAQFANAPLGAIAFACTGASYLVGRDAEDAAVARLEARSGIPFVTAARAVCDAFTALGASRIGLVSPYPADLTEASVAYWSSRGLTVGRVVAAAPPGDSFHPIYAMSAGSAAEALAGMRGAGVDAVVMLGTGMPTLKPILDCPAVDGAPVISCMTALAWRSLVALRGTAPDGAGLRRWIAGEGWRARYAQRMGG
ncbi:aspartate/glutamate racemase family protein [Roseomonas sp. PWR1]|uniref:Aspartate/glutamate racemase family protein n=1 Tax=Roseomonas nitratireducens TaxID=2820810 RepID=A0ABS4AN57_9PROT|nr:aspartate/glutamate racemase family protein [Neoroseomonas nitratireducens]MBP0462800.1 aspartate/glutamate racemase family protein [Neoroseomonas nitratireducens]